MEGYFTMMMVVDLSACGEPFDKLRAASAYIRRGPWALHPDSARGYLRRDAQAVRGIAMLNLQNIFDTIDMIDKQHLDIRTITMGISLLDCVSEDPKALLRTRFTTRSAARAEHLVKTGEDIESEFGIPIVNKRISVTPIALIAGSVRDRGLCSLCKDAGPRSQDLRRELHRRLFRTRAEGLCHGRRTAPARHSAGAGRDGSRLLERERRLDEGGHQYGRRGAHGPHHQADGAPHA